MPRLSLKTEVKIVICSIIIGLFTTSLILSKLYSEGVTNRISQKFIRFHVIASSDSEVDQQLKLKVRDGVLSTIADDISKCESIEETRAYLLKSLPHIETEAERIIAREGFKYTTNASLERTMFPTRQYGDMTLVAGEYEALRLEIGEGNGRNWWCVVYPPLCYVDVSRAEIQKELKDKIKDGFSEDDYKLLMSDEESVSVKVRFKIVELWQEGKLSALAMFKK